ncbi:hypothetical protein PAEPH01_1557 [Pancytospora epiphaga]|nr:hypothetical protein PAEPH01_1557 [Pancytospora epiphaga]
MLEYAIYGIMNKKFDWKGENFKRLEKIYSRKGQRVILQSKLCPNALSDLISKGSLSKQTLVDGCSQDCECEHILINRSHPDPNRHRTSIATQVTKARLAPGINPDDYLTCLGYKECKSRLIEGVLYRRCKYSIELTRVIADYSVENLEEKDELEIQKKYFLVKVYIEDKEPGNSEEILNGACIDLEDDVILTKPSLENF